MKVRVVVLSALLLPLIFIPPVRGAVPPSAPGSRPTPTERRLHIAQVEASSFLWNSWNQFQENYHPLYLADDDPATAWVEGAPGPGVGEWVRLKLTPMDGATVVRLRLRNGYQKSPALFAANARVKALSVTLLPSGKQQKATLRDTEGWQELTLEQPSGPLIAVELKVETIYPGRRYEDLCISDVQVFVTALTRENPAFEKSRLDKVLSWKAERKKAAELFRTATRDDMPIAPQYVVQEAGKGAGQTAAEDRECEYSDPFCSARVAMGALESGERAPSGKAAIAVARAAIEGRFRGFAPVQAVPKDRRPLPKVDGLCTPDLNSCFDGGGCGGNLELPIAGMLGFLSAAQVGIFSVKQAPSIEAALRGDPAPCKRKDAGAMFAWAQTENVAGDPGAANGTGEGESKATLRALLLVRCGAVEGREGMVPSALAQLLVYGPDGHLALVAGRGYASTLAFRERTKTEAELGDTGPLLTSGRRASSYGEPLRGLSEAAPIARR